MSKIEEFKLVDFLSYIKNETDRQFFIELYEDLKVSQIPLNLEYSNYGFQIDPGGNGAEVWHLGEMVGKFETMEDLFFNFKLDGKPLIERLSEIEYA